MSLKKKAKKVVPPTPMPMPRFDEERRQLIAAVAFATIGWDARASDFAMAKFLTQKCASEPEVIEAIAEYCWDHLMGEPRNPSLKRVIKAIQHNMSGPAINEVGKP